MSDKPVAWLIAASLIADAMLPRHRSPGRALKTCFVEGCERHVDSRGMCSRHYRQWSRAHPEEIRRGSYRPAQDPDNPLTVRVQTKVSEQLAQRLDEAREERSRSEYLRELLAKELNKE